jgi:hypothetical protein
VGHAVDANDLDNTIASPHLEHAHAHPDRILAMSFEGQARGSQVWKKDVAPWQPLLHFDNFVEVRIDFSS